jgi:hypothetical protein
MRSWSGCTGKAYDVTKGPDPVVTGDEGPDPFVTLDASSGGRTRTYDTRIMIPLL